MSQLRFILATIFLVVVGYTIPVIANHGMGLIPIFFGDIAKMEWPGQFNLDFLGFLTLSGLWIAWRNDFSSKGLVLGVLGLFLGAPFLSAYLLYESRSCGEDFSLLFLGPSRAGR